MSRRWPPWRRRRGARREWRGPAGRGRDRGRGGRCRSSARWTGRSFRRLAPGRTRPASMAAAAPSTMPTRTGVPAAKPLAAAATGVTWPTICAHGSAGGSLAASRPMADDQLGGPALGGAVKEHGERPHGVVHAVCAAEPVGDVAVGLEHLVGARIEVGRVFLEPEQLRCQEVRVDAAAVDGGDPVLADSRAQPARIDLLSGGPSR